MLSTDVSFYACPTCGGDLGLRAFDRRDDDILEGVLVCAKCSAVWIVDRGIPRFVPYGAYQRSADFLMRHKERLVDIGGELVSEFSLKTLHELQSKTEDHFGYEWDHWKDLGFTDTQGRTKEREAVTFTNKSFLTQASIVGRKVLDAGCGNGRYARVAGEFGAEVYAFDLGTGSTEATAHNCKDLPNVHVAQGDIFRPPFRKGVFDAAYSISVLMHTGDARKAFAALVPFVKTGGTFSAHLYHKGNALYEVVDAVLRRFTLRMDKKRLMDWSVGAAKLCGLLPFKLQIAANLVMRIEPHPVYVFDWYGAPIATHHTYPELFGWIAENGLELSAHADRPHRFPWWKRFVKPPFFLTVQGRVR